MRLLLEYIFVQKPCSCVWTYYFCAENRERLLLKENVQHIVLLYVEDCMAASRNILMFLNERAAASEKILTTASERKKCAAAS